MQPKWFIFSKTLWVGVLQKIVAAYTIYAGSIPTKYAGLALLLFSIANDILRFLTDTTLTFKKPE